GPTWWSRERGARYVCDMGGAPIAPPAREREGAVKKSTGAPHRAIPANVPTVAPKPCQPCRKKYARSAGSSSHAHGQAIPASTIENADSSPPTPGSVRNARLHVTSVAGSITSGRFRHSIVPGNTQKTVAIVSPSHASPPNISTNRSPFTSRAGVGSIRVMDSPSIQWSRFAQETPSWSIDGGQAFTAPACNPYTSGDRASLPGASPYGILPVEV